MLQMPNVGTCHHKLQKGPKVHENGDHHTKQCSESGNIVAKCANCDGPHISNYYECPTYIRRVQQIQERKAHLEQKTGKPQYIDDQKYQPGRPQIGRQNNNREQTRPSRGRIDASEDANSQIRGPREIHTTLGSPSIPTQEGSNESRGSAGGNSHFKALASRVIKLS
ncbi:hypothetical protein JTB14_020730 [Gonioctena quinquepunctata]|nr:hypothetical protein JTB14_020730 [Gonioctena quinquepunctata]